jgi:hypothetical protein
VAIARSGLGHCVQDRHFAIRAALVFARSLKATGATRDDVLRDVAIEAKRVVQITAHRDSLILAASVVGCSLREIAEATGLSHMTVKRIIDRRDGTGGREEERVVEDTWSQYENRYAQRPATFQAYVDVWQRIPRARASFRGWAGFSQAANAEPAQSGDRVRAAEECMRLGGYELGSQTARGARRWVKTNG